MSPICSRLERWTFATAVAAGLIFVVAMCATASVALSAEGFDPACLSKLSSDEAFDVRCLAKLESPVPAAKPSKGVAEQRTAKPKATIWCIPNCAPCNAMTRACAAIDDVDITIRQYDAITAPVHVKQAVAQRMGFPLIDVPHKPLRSGAMSAKDFIAFVSSP